MIKFNLKEISTKLFVASVIPPAIVALFACAAFSLVNSGIVMKNMTATTNASLYKLKGEIQEVLQPNMNKMSNWKAIVQEIHEEKALSRVMKGISNDLATDTMFYYATSISRFRRNGFFLNSMGWVPDKDWMPSSRDWFKAAVDNDGDFTFIEPYIDDRTGRTCTTFSQAVKDSKGTILGVAAMDVMLDELSDLVATSTISPNSRVYILLSDGRYLTNPDSSKIISENYFTPEKEKELLKAGFSKETLLNSNEKTFIQGTSYYAVTKIGASPWYILAEGPVSDFNANFKRNMFVILLIMLLLGCISALFNVSLIGSMRGKEKLVAQKLSAEIQNLAVSSKENAATSQDQSASVKEIVATMEDNTALSENISQKINGVTQVASKTNEDVAEGVAYLEENVNRLKEIASANQDTIDGIKSLGDRIENIWDIVTLINSVADQAKIIAFNAELEASSAGEAGRNFHIVATEIRRLADGIIDGTKEIKSKITEIQQSSDSLILLSESGTEKIQKGVQTASALSERFTSIKNASEITAESSQEITTIIQQQAIASEQILITLKQIANGTESFSAATENISAASQQLKSIMEDLNK
ncbi:MAG: hypothetical protein J6I53_12110 [Treponema sp.]|nr:hypothetical protein [Treponema sp.]